MLSPSFSYETQDAKQSKETSIREEADNEKKPLHLLLFASGIPRKEAYKLVVAGRVRVNGEIIADPSVTARLPGDTIAVDDRPPIRRERLRYVLVHKPRGYMCVMHDDKNEWRRGRPLISSLIPSTIQERLGDAGRLDLDSEGLVLLTNDQGLKEHIKRPNGSCRKRYVVTVKGSPTEEKLTKLRQGCVCIGNMGKLLDCRIKVLEVIPAIPGEDIRGFTRLEVELREGKKNQIRRMFGFIGHHVVRLLRIAIGPLLLGDLPSGQVRELDDSEIHQLYNNDDNNKTEQTEQLPEDGTRTPPAKKPKCQ